MTPAEEVFEEGSVDARTYGGLDIVPTPPADTPPDEAVLEWTPSPRLTCGDPDWFTDPAIVAAARQVLGRIDLDPASEAAANEVIQADEFYDTGTNGLLQAWHGRIFLNPPGGKDGAGQALVPQFWNELVRAWTRGDVTEAIWVGYSLEQLQTLQNSSTTGMTPLDFPFCIPSRRIPFVENPERKARREAAGKKKSGPTHANYIVYLGDALGRERFYEVFESIGAVNRDAIHHAVMTEKDPSTCVWKEDPDSDSWDGACGNKWSFINDGPKENGVKFCQYCGKHVVAFPYVEEPAA